jgi:peptide/nickel transport system substrate-binding protein
VRIRLPEVAAAGALLFLAACSTGRRAADVLVIGVGGSLNLGTNNPVVIQRNANVWETLTELDDSLTPQPQLAEAWEVSSDGTQWTFRLRKDVRFHNGERLSAGLVAANVRRLKDHPELDYYNMFVHLAEVSAVDESTLRLRFNGPAVDLPSKLGHYFAGIFSPSAFGPDGRLTSPVGSGPYVFAESRIGQYDRVAAFEQYHGGKPYFREIEFRIIPDPVVRVMSLIRGDIDMIAHQGGIPAPYLDMLRKDPAIVVASQDVAITHYLLFNCARGPFQKRECRDAFSRSLDRSGLVDRFLQGTGSAAGDFLIDSASRWKRGRFPLAPEHGEDTRQALRACTAGAPVSLLLNQGDTGTWGYRQVADYLADYYGRLGVQVRVGVLEGGAWQKATQDGDYDITLYPLSMPTGTPELLIRRLAFSEGMRVRGIGNTTHFSSPRIDALFSEAINAREAIAQERQFNQILDLLATEVPFVPIYHERYYYAYRRGISGVHVDPFLKIDLGRMRRVETAP